MRPSARIAVSVRLRKWPRRKACLRCDSTLGTGDSADIQPEADQLELWTADVTAAVGELRQRTGVPQVCLLGLRLGATLATLAARRTEAVTSLVLIAPVIIGRPYLRGFQTRPLAA